jgi:hypothetical protein
VPAASSATPDIRTGTQAQDPIDCRDRQPVSLKGTEI